MFPSLNLYSFNTAIRVILLKYKSDNNAPFPISLSKSQSPYSGLQNFTGQALLTLLPPWSHMLLDHSVPDHADVLLLLTDPRHFPTLRVFSLASPIAWKLLSPGICIANSLVSFKFVCSSVLFPVKSFSDDWLHSYLFSLNCHQPYLIYLITFALLFYPFFFHSICQLVT